MRNISQSWLNRKLCLIMRVSFLLLLTTFMLSGVLIADKVNSQSVSKLEFNNIGKFSISVGFQTSTLGEVLDLIEQQTRITFSYATALRVLPVGNLNYNNADLATILQQIQNEVHVDFVQVDGMIAVTPVKQTMKALPIVYASVDGSIAEQQSRNLVDGSNLRVREIPQTNQVGVIRGRVVDARNDDALAGASIFIQSLARGAVANAEGEFDMAAVPVGTYTMVVSFIGYRRQDVEVVVTSGQTTEIEIRMLAASTSLQEVEIVSTGYQLIPRERATGSFSIVSSELVENQVSTGILDRLIGNVSGMVFTNHAGTRDAIQIRGRNTIFANANPLIVLDGFPYDGDINNINPNDVLNVTVLKDAAAASIWGSRASNGVIVIETKRSRLNQPLQASISSSTTIGEVPDLYFQPKVSSAEYIEIEEWLFNEGYYNTAMNSIARTPLTPAVEIMRKRRDGIITNDEAEQQLNVLRGLDIRDDFTKYLYQNSVFQQISMNVGGGGSNYTYYLSAGVDNNKTNLIRNDYQRISLNSRNTFSPIDNLTLSANFIYTQTSTSNNNVGHSGIFSRPGNQIYPYARLVDDNGNSLPIVKNHSYEWIISPQNNHLLDWQYRPIDELYLADDVTNVFDTRIQTSANYKFTDWLEGEISQQFQKSTSHQRNHKSIETYEMRDLINAYTRQNPDGTLIRPLPLGGSLLNTDRILTSNTFRSNIRINKDIFENDRINGIAGFEVRDVVSDFRSNILYGYNDDYGTSVAAIDFDTFHPRYPTGSGRITNTQSITESTNRFISYYSNLSYSHDNKYVLSLSARKDASNLFGVRTNQKGVPLWSAGLSWDISREDFYNFDLIPYLKIRSTYGYNGNTYNDISAYLSAFYLTSSLSGLRGALIQNPPYPDLRWERVKLTNFALEFGSINNRITGNIEYYTKRGVDIIGAYSVAPMATIGTGTVQRNVAETKGSGLDVTLNTINIDRAIKWTSTIFVSTVKDQVTKYDVPTSAAALVGSNQPGNWSVGFLYPVIGRPVYTVYSYRWAGLNPQTGDPQGYLNGEVSSDYTSILNTTTVDELIYHGSASPTNFGSIRNTVTWKSLSVSANITYKFGYFFRKQSINYSGATFWSNQHGDYSNRWQQQGDENFTNVPSRPQLPMVANRDNLYLRSEIHVQKGDHIRLQDVRFTYDLSDQLRTITPINRLQVYAHANNLGLIWTANEFGIDPDSQIIPTPRSISFGVKMDF